jgi:hypothetical protein
MATFKLYTILEYKLFGSQVSCIYILHTLSKIVGAIVLNHIKSIALGKKHACLC